MKLLQPLHGYFPILQGFGPSSIDYSRFGLIGHSGIDYECPIGTPAYASETGTVTKLQTDKDGFGLHVRLSHYESGKEVGRTIYAHLSEVDCRMGQKVRAGDLIAETGDSGFSSVPHLHFEYRPVPLQNNGYNGAIDPTPYFDAPEAATTPQEPYYNIPESGVAIVTSAIGLKIRTESSTKSDDTVVGYWLYGKSFPYEAIVREGGDVWAKFVISGKAHYSGVLNSGNLNCRFVEK